MAEARDAAAISQRPRHRLADDIAGVLRGVVEVDVQISFRMQGDIDQAMPGELFEHVIEKPDAGRDLCGAAAVEIHSAGDPGFLGVAFDRRHPHDTLLEGPHLRHILVTTFARAFHCRAICTAEFRA